MRKWDNWEPTFPPMKQPIPDDEDLPDQPVRTPVNRNGLPLHRPYRPSPDQLRADTFSRHCQRGKHARCERACCCFCHG